MWKCGIIDGCQWEAKVFDNGSHFGIDDGRISKLYIYGPNGEVLCVYERGWHGERPSDGIMGLVNKIVALFPVPKADLKENV